MPATCEETLKATRACICEQRSIVAQLTEELSALRNAVTEMSNDAQTMVQTVALLSGMCANNSQRITHAANALEDFESRLLQIQSAMLACAVQCD